MPVVYGIIPFNSATKIHIKIFINNDTINTTYIDKINWFQWEISDTTICYYTRSVFLIMFDVVDSVCTDQFISFQNFGLVEYSSVLEYTTLYCASFLCSSILASCHLWFPVILSSSKDYLYSLGTLKAYLYLTVIWNKCNHTTWFTNSIIRSFFTIYSMLELFPVLLFY